MLFDAEVRSVMLECADFFCFAISIDLSGESFVIKLVRLILAFVSTVESSSKK